MLPNHAVWVERITRPGLLAQFCFRFSDGNFSTTNRISRFLCFSFNLLMRWDSSRRDPNLTQELRKINQTRHNQIFKHKLSVHKTYQILIASPSNETFSRRLIISRNSSNNKLRLCRRSRAIDCRPPGRPAISQFLKHNRLLDHRRR